MKKIKLITDSTCDLPKDVLEKNNIEVMPLLINFGEESYLDGIEISQDELFEKIESGNIFPTTAQVTPNRFLEVFENAKKNNEILILVLISSVMSGTYQSACLAKEMSEYDDIYIVDSKSTCSGLGVLVLRAANLIKEGKSVQEIIDDLEKEKYKINSSLSFDSLDNLIKGGRISKTIGVVTGILGIKLILEIKDGLMAVKDKVRGNKKAVKRIIQDVEKYGYRKDLPVILVNVDMEDIAGPLREYLKANNIDFIETTVGCTVAIHAGKKASGLFFISE